MMNGIFGQLDQSFKAVWVSNSGAVGKGISLKNLAPEQIAVFPADKYCSSDGLVSLEKFDWKTTKRVIIKQGLVYGTGANTPALSLQTKFPRQSMEFSPKDIVKWEGKAADTSESRPQIVAIGYDGFDASKSLNAMVKNNAKPVHVHVTLSGEIIRRKLNRNFYEFKMILDKDFCPSDCECVDTCGEVNCDLLADQIIKQVENDKIVTFTKSGRMLNVPLKELMKVNKLKKCTTPEVAPELTEEKKYLITICDDGVSTLGKLAAEYGCKIELESRVDSVSTYSMWLPASEPAPADFKMSSYTYTVCDTCPTCPEEFTKIPGVKIVQVRVACGGTAPALPGEIESTKISSSLTGGDVYLKKVALTTTDEEIEAAAVDCSILDILNDERALCKGEEATFTWKSCESCFKTTKKYMITLPSLDCAKGESRLLELQAAYPDNVVEEYTMGDCVGSYKICVESDCVAEEECGKLVRYNFQAPPSYQGVNWVDEKVILTDPTCEVPAAVTPPCCVCGVTFEGAFMHNETEECTFGWGNWNPNDIRGLKIQVNIHSMDWSDNPCDITPIYSTELQKLHLNTGLSGDYLQEIERNFLIYEGKVFDFNPYINKNSGFNIVAKAHEKYDYYALTLKHRHDGTSYITPEQKTITYYFCFPIGAGKSFEAMMNELVLSSGNPELTAVVL